MVNKVIYGDFRLGYISIVRMPGHQQRKWAYAILIWQIGSFQVCTQYQPIRHQSHTCVGLQSAKASTGTMMMTNSVILLVKMLCLSNDMTQNCQYGDIVAYHYLIHCGLWWLHMLSKVLVIKCFWKYNLLHVGHFAQSPNPCIPPFPIQQAPATLHLCSVHVSAISVMRELCCIFVCCRPGFDSWTWDIFLLIPADRLHHITCGLQSSQLATMEAFSWLSSYINLL